MTADTLVAESQPTYRREHVETLIGYRLLGGLFALFSGLAILAPAASSLYQLVVCVPVALLCLVKGAEKLPGFRGDAAPRPTHSAVLASYVVAALICGWLSFGTWHATSRYQFSGFERGAGWYTLVFAVLLLLSAAALQQPNLMRPFDLALHVVALVCGTIFIGAAISGTFSQGVSSLRAGVLACGIVTVVVSSGALKRRCTDSLSRQGRAAALFASSGAVMAASSFMSWGAGGFIVNYWPGTSIGGFDGRVTLWSGGAIVALWIGHFLFGRHDEDRWTNSVRATAALGFAGLTAVVNASRGTSHPGRALAATACVFVLIQAARAMHRPGTDGLPETEPLPAPGESTSTSFVGAAFAGVLSVLGIALFSVGSAEASSTARFRFDRELDYDGLMAGITFGGLGLVLILAALGSGRGQVLSANVGAVVAGGMALILAVVSRDDMSTPILVMAALLAAAAAAGLMATSWIRPQAGNNLTARLWAILRHKWWHVLAAALAANLLRRWVLNPLLPYPEFGSDGYQRAALVQALSHGGMYAALALLTIRNNRILRSVLLIAAATAGYVALRMAIFSALPTAQSSDTWMVEFAFSIAALLLFAIGRGRGSFACLTVVAAVTNGALMELLFYFAVPSSAWRTPVIGEVIRALPLILPLAALATFFLAFPLDRSKANAGALVPPALGEV